MEAARKTLSNAVTIEESVENPQTTFAVAAAAAAAAAERAAGC